MRPADRQGKARGGFLFGGAASISLRLAPIFMAKSPGRNSIRRYDMPLQNHLTELERRHQTLEREIQDALTHPSIDDLKLAELKRKKLQLKDEIAKLKGATARVVH
jgi:hypothetical protein